MSQPEWKDILETIESRTTEETTSQSVIHSTSNNEKETQQAQPPSADLGIESPDGSYPWLHYPDKGWKVPCPYCDESVFNSEEAFRNHWSDSERCHVPADRELEELTTSADGGKKSNSRQSGEHFSIDHSPSQIASQAEGSFSENILTKTSGRLIDQQLVDYLRPDEYSVPHKAG